ncbi:MAG: nucleoside hydrolase [Anaerolineae bacterium]|nr:nucleoside hydrolase [Anaerolineae bacterium]
MRKFIIDTDTASDDAVALVMALRWHDVEVEAITVVAGNVPVEMGARNALYTAQMCGSRAPVYIGAARPLVREYENATWFHGRDGMGDMNYPAPERAPEAKHAVDAIIDTVKANPGIEMVTLAPLTNVALALSRAPEIAGMVSRCVVMGGAACTVGNVTPAAEYNVWCDPEAARIVFRSGMAIEMVGWELARREANIMPDEMAHIRGFGTPLAHFALDCNRRAFEAGQEQSGDPGLGLCDPVAMAVALDPAVAARTSRHYVDVEVQGELTRGMTVVDALGVASDERNRDLWQPLVRREPNVTVCWGIDIPRWKEMLYSVLR